MARKKTPAVKATYNYSLLSCDIVLCFRALVNKNT